MSDSEPTQKPAHIEPSEELSIHIRFDSAGEEEITLLLADYPPQNIIAGRNKFFRIVTFDSPQERAAQKERLEQKLQGKDAKISDYIKSIRQQRLEESRRKVYVSGFSAEVSKEELTAVFSGYGEIEEVIMLKTKSRRRSYEEDEEKENADEAEHNKPGTPYAFIRFKENDSAINAVKEKTEIEGTSLLVEASRFKPYMGFPSRGESSIMISNLNDSVTKESITKAVGEVGDVFSLRFNADHAIVSFTDSKMAEKAISDLNGSKIDGQEVLVVNAPRTGGGFRGRGRRGTRNRRRAPRRNEKSDAASAKKPEKDDQ